ncbi:MAG: histidine phosphatase family protein [Frankia sp.]|nr:histidine phosphatase family protein [Frankia sp.]
MGRVVLIRHGQTEWSRAGRHTGRTDVPLTPEGERLAAALRSWLGEFRFVLVATSPRVRASRTAELAGLTGGESVASVTGATERLVWPELAEWDYGELEGLTTATIRRDMPGWTVWRGPVPGGETADEVGARADTVLSRVGRVLGRGDVALVGHGHMLRVLIARWLGLDPRCGALFLLEAGGLSVLGHERETAVISRLNLPAQPAGQGG